MLLHVTDVLPRSPHIPEGALYRGRWVHRACELFDRGTLDWSTVAPEWEGYVRAWQRCRGEIGLDVLRSETRVEDAQHGYCGALDRVVQGIRRRRYVLEIKTNTTPETTGLQTAAYLHALRDRTVQGRAVAELHDGTYRLTFDTTPGQTLFRPQDFRVFLAYLTAARWEIANGLRPMPGPREDEA